MTILIMRHGHKAEGDFFNPKLRHQDPPLAKREIIRQRVLFRISLGERYLQSIQVNIFALDIQ